MSLKDKIISIVSVIIICLCAVVYVRAGKAPDIQITVPEVPVYNLIRPQVSAPDVYVDCPEIIQKIEQRYTSKQVSLIILNYLKQTDIHYQNIIEVTPEYQSNGIWWVKIERKSIAVYYQDLIFDEELGVL